MANKVILKMFLYFYSVSSVLILLAFVMTVLNGSTMFILLPYAVVAGMIAYGIYNKLSWIPFVITILAAFSIITNLIKIPEEPLVSLIMVTVLIFEAYFFNKKEIKQLFHVKHMTTFY